MRSRLARGNVLVVAEKLDFLFGRDMKHMDPLADLVCEFDETLRRHQRGGLVAPDRMGSRVALYAQPLALIEAVLILRMKRGAAPYNVQNAAQAFVVLDQQRAGGEPMNTLTPAHPGARSSSGRSCTLSRVPPMKNAKSQCIR